MPSHCGDARLLYLLPRQGLEIFGQHALVAGKGERRKRIDLEHADLQHLRAGRNARTSGEAPAIGDADHARRPGLGDVIYAEQSGQLDLGADLFEAFPNRGVGRILVVVDETAWQAPQAIARLDRPASQDDTTIDLHDHSCRDLGVTPQNEAVVWACFQLTTIDDTRHQRGAAVDAKVSHQRGGYDALVS
jgi:hypothetical protein